MSTGDATTMGERRHEEFATRRVAGLSRLERATIRAWPRQMMTSVGRANGL